MNQTDTGLGAFVAVDLADEERRLQAAVVAKVPAAAAPLAALNKSRGFSNPFVARVARFGWIVRPMIRARTRTRSRARRVTARATTRARSPGRRQPEPEPEPPTRPTSVEAVA